MSVDGMKSEIPSVPDGVESDGAEPSLEPTEVTPA